MQCGLKALKYLGEYKKRNCILEHDKVRMLSSSHAYTAAKPSFLLSPAYFSSASSLTLGEAATLCEQKTMARHMLSEPSG
jgi:hypothetical protein